MALGIGLAISGGLGLAGALAGGDAQRSSANNAADVQREMFKKTQANLSPWMGTGRASLDKLGELLGVTDNQSGPDWKEYLKQNPDVAASATYGNNPQQHYEDYGKKEGRNLPQFSPHAQSPDFGSLAKPFSLADFQASPAYQFNLQEGQKAIDKHANAKGNLYAPQTLQDISKYSQGVASNEFQNAFSNYNVNQNNLFGRLQTLSSGGQNAAANLGGIGAQTAGQIGGDMIGAGNANAAGIVGGVNAATGAYGDYLNYGLMNQLINQQRPTYSVNAGAGGGQVFGGS